jgi:hypothetical protein
MSLAVPEVLGAVPVQIQVEALPVLRRTVPFMFRKELS